METEEEIATDQHEGGGTAADEEAHWVWNSGPTFTSFKSFGRLGSKPLLRRTVPYVDPFNAEATQLESGACSDTKKHTFMTTLHLAFQAIGIAYGDMGTSPLYVFSSAFHAVQIGGEVDVLGALSIIIYTLTLIPLIKYVSIVLHANNNGEGSTLSLYALICRYANVNLLPNQQPTYEHLSNFRLQMPTTRLERALKIKYGLEKSFTWKTVLFVMILLGTSLVMGNGILTPCISDITVVASIAILILLFSLQRFGTEKVGFVFSPILLVWFIAIGSIGTYNILIHEWRVVYAFNPLYIYSFFRRNHFQSWHSLGGLVLCITGGEAMYADLGHFSTRAIQIAFSCVVYPCLLLAYMGQAAYLIRYPSGIENTFYHSIPGKGT